MNKGSGNQNRFTLDTTQTQLKIQDEQTKQILTVMLVLMKWMTVVTAITDLISRDTCISVTTWVSYTLPRGSRVP